MKSWDHNLLHGIDSCFCCMGGRTGRGVTEFYKTDYTYYVEFAELAKLSGVPHYSLISSRSVSSNSRFLYMRVKGQANDAILKLGLPFVSIFKPGFLLNRRNDFRLSEKFAAMIPFMEKIQTTVLAEKMAIDCINYHLKTSEKLIGSKIYNNKDIINIHLL